MAQSLATFRTVVFMKQPAYRELREVFDAVNEDYQYAVFRPDAGIAAIASEIYETDLTVYFPGNRITWARALEELGARSLRPATYEEMLGFAAPHFDARFKGAPVFAAGSVALIGKEERIACLWHDNRGRVLDLGWYGRDFREYCGLLAARLAG